MLDGENRLETHLVTGSPEIEFTRPDTLWDMHGIKNKADDVSDDGKTKWGCCDDQLGYT